MGLGAFPARQAVRRHARHARHLRSQHGHAELRRAARRRRALRRPRDRQPGALHRAGRKIIHIDIDPSSISKRVKVDIPIVGDVKDVLQELIAQIKTSESSPSARPWPSGGTDREVALGGLPQVRPQFRDHQAAVRGREALGTDNGDAFITSDVGQHQMWAAQYYKFDEPRRWINSGGLGTMGVGLPYAMGIKLAFPDKEVVCITGEGSIQMCIQELSTCLQYDTPVKICSLNNRYLGMVRQWQEIEYDNRYSHSYMDALPDFVKLAEAYGHVGMRIEKSSDVEPALREAFRLKDRTVFLDFQTDPTENVWPMVQAGKGISEMLRRGGPVMRHIISVLLENEPARCRAWWACFRPVATTSRR
jgi:acetolactate synthase-1/2/3 large subunit